MEILAWVNVGLGAFLAVVCLMLYVDGRGRRKTVKALEATIAAQDIAIGALSRAMLLPCVEPAPAVPSVEPATRAMLPTTPTVKRADREAPSTVPNRSTPRR